jgi:hypothetical protein
LLPVNQELIKALDALLAGLYSCFPMGAALQSQEWLLI